MLQRDVNLLSVGIKILLLYPNGDYVVLKKAGAGPMDLHLQHWQEFSFLFRLFHILMKLIIHCKDMIYNPARKLNDRIVQDHCI